MYKLSKNNISKYKIACSILTLKKFVEIDAFLEMWQNIPFLKPNSKETEEGS